MHPRLAIALALGLGAAAASCAAALVRPTAADVAIARSRWPAASLETLERGRGLYVQHCAGCHNLFRPEQVPPEKWLAMVDDMARNANLAPGESDLVVQYLVSASARLRGEAGAATRSAATRGSAAP